jgi:hypothetical protein
MFPGDVLHRVGDRGEVVRPECRRDEHDAGVFDIRGDELPGQLGEIPDVARDDGAVGAGGMSKLAAVVEPRVAYLVRADHVEPAGPQNLGDARREVLVEVERHMVVDTVASAGASRRGRRDGFRPEGLALMRRAYDARPALTGREYAGPSA